MKVYSLSFVKIQEKYSQQSLRGQNVSSNVRDAFRF